MVKRMWLLFAQAVTLLLAVWFVVTTLKPEWVSARPSVSITTQNLSALPPAKTLDVSSISFKDAARSALPAVVHIVTSGRSNGNDHPLFGDPIFRRFFGVPDDDNRSTSLGSGVIVSEKGYVLTNYHVIESADQIEVGLYDTRRFKADVVGSDPDTDLAILHITSKDVLPQLAFAPSDSLHVGDIVLAIGNPFGVGQTVTMGIVSALGRSHLGLNTFENFIQTDAAINPGNSGGALVDSSGRLVGINSAIYSKSGGAMGIGFAIPAATAQQVLTQIVAHGKVIRGWIGVESQDITPELAAALKLDTAQGALVTSIYRNSPAHRAGIRPGDVLQQFGEAPVRDSNGLLVSVAAAAPGETITVLLSRRGKSMTIPVNVAQRPSSSKDGR